MRAEYTLEYGTDSLEVHQDAFGPGDRVLDLAGDAGQTALRLADAGARVTALRGGGALAEDLARAAASGRDAWKLQHIVREVVGSQPVYRITGEYGYGNRYFLEGFFDLGGGYHHLFNMPLGLLLLSVCAWCVQSKCYCRSDSAATYGRF